MLAPISIGRMIFGHQCTVFSRLAFVTQYDMGPWRVHFEDFLRDPVIKAEHFALTESFRTIEMILRFATDLSLFESPWFSGYQERLVIFLQRKKVDVSDVESLISKIIAESYNVACISPEDQLEVESNLRGVKESTSRSDDDHDSIFDQLQKCHDTINTEAVRLSFRDALRSLIKQYK